MICDFERSPSHTQSGRHGAAAPVRAIQIMGKKRDEYISRTLVRLLRYDASNFGLAQDADGFCSVHELLKLEEFESVYSFAAEMLRIATSSIGKYGPRFEMRGDLFVRAALRGARGDRRTSDRRTKHRRSPESRKNHGSLRGKRKPRGGKWAADGGKWAADGGKWAVEDGGKWAVEDGGDWAVGGDDWAVDGGKWAVAAGSDCAAGGDDCAAGGGDCAAGGGDCAAAEVKQDVADDFLATYMIQNVYVFAGERLLFV